MTILVITNSYQVLKLKTAITKRTTSEIQTKPMIMLLLEKNNAIQRKMALVSGRGGSLGFRDGNGLGSGRVEQLPTCQQRGYG
jgi:hypothetical protein